MRLSPLSRYEYKVSKVKGTIARDIQRMGPTNSGLENTTFVNHGAATNITKADVQDAARARYIPFRWTPLTATQSSIAALAAVKRIRVLSSPIRPNTVA